MAEAPKKLNKAWIVVPVLVGVAMAALVVVIIVKKRQEPTKGIGGTEQEVLPAVVSHAFDHAPAECEIALRFDVAKLLKAPVGKPLETALMEVKNGTHAPNTRVRDFLGAAQIDPLKNVTDVLVCVKDVDLGVQGQKLAVVVAGSFHPELIVTAALSNEAEKAEAGAIGGRSVANIEASGGLSLTIGQAPDAAIIFSNNPELFTAAMTAKPVKTPPFDLTADSEATGALTPAFFKGSPRFVNGPLAPYVSSIVKVSGWASFGTPKGQIRVTMNDPKIAADFAKTAADLLVKAAARDPSAADAGLTMSQEAFTGAKAKANGADVVIDLVWSADFARKAMEKLSERLQEANSKGELAL